MSELTVPSEERAMVQLEAWKVKLEGFKYNYKMALKYEERAQKDFRSSFLLFASSTSSSSSSSYANKNSNYIINLLNDFVKSVVNTYMQDSENPSEKKVFRSNITKKIARHSFEYILSHLMELKNVESELIASHLEIHWRISTAEDLHQVLQLLSEWTEPMFDALSQAIAREKTMANEVGTRLLTTEVSRMIKSTKSSISADSRRALVSSASASLDPSSASSSPPSAPAPPSVDSSSVTGKKRKDPPTSTDDPVRPPISTDDPVRPPTSSDSSLCPPATSSESSLHPPTSTDNPVPVRRSSRQNPLTAQQKKQAVQLSGAAFNKKVFNLFRTKHELDLITIEDDGNCYYRAIAKYLHNEEGQFQQIKEELLQWTLDNESRVRESIFANDSEGFTKLVQSLVEKGEWTFDNRIVSLTCAFYKITVILYNATEAHGTIPTIYCPVKEDHNDDTQSEITLPSSSPPPPPPPPRKPLLLFYTGKHFSVLVRNDQNAHSNYDEYPAWTYAQIEQAGGKLLDIELVTTQLSEQKALGTVVSMTRWCAMSDTESHNLFAPPIPTETSSEHATAASTVLATTTIITTTDSTSATVPANIGTVDQLCITPDEIGEAEEGNQSSAPWRDCSDAVTKERSATTITSAPTTLSPSSTSPSTATVSTLTSDSPFSKKSTLPVPKIMIPTVGDSGRFNYSSQLSSVTMRRRKKRAKTEVTAKDEQKDIPSEGGNHMSSNLTVQEDLQEEGDEETLELDKVIESFKVPILVDEEMEIVHLSFDNYHKAQCTIEFLLGECHRLQSVVNQQQQPVPLQDIFSPDNTPLEEEEEAALHTLSTTLTNTNITRVPSTTTTNSATTTTTNSSTAATTTTTTTTTTTAATAAATTAATSAATSAVATSPSAAMMMVDSQDGKEKEGEEELALLDSAENTFFDDMHMDTVL